MWFGKKGSRGGWLCGGVRQEGGRPLGRGARPSGALSLHVRARGPNFVTFAHRPSLLSFNSSVSDQPGRAYLRKQRRVLKYVRVLRMLRVKTGLRALARAPSGRDFRTQSACWVEGLPRRPLKSR